MARSTRGGDVLTSSRSPTWPTTRSATGRSSLSPGERFTTRVPRVPITPGWHGSSGPTRYRRSLPTTWVPVCSACSARWRYGSSLVLAGTRAARHAARAERFGSGHSTPGSWGVAAVGYGGRVRLVILMRGLPGRWQVRDGPGILNGGRTRRWQGVWRSSPWCTTAPRLPGRLRCSSCWQSAEAGSAGFGCGSGPGTLAVSLAADLADTAGAGRAGARWPCAVPAGVVGVVQIAATAPQDHVMPHRCRRGLGPRRTGMGCHPWSGIAYRLEAAASQILGEDLPPATSQYQSPTRRDPPTQQRHLLHAEDSVRGGVWRL